MATGRFIIQILAFLLLPLAVSLARLLEAEESLSPSDCLEVVAVVLVMGMVILTDERCPMSSLCLGPKVI